MLLNPPLSPPPGDPADPDGEELNPDEVADGDDTKDGWPRGDIAVLTRGELLPPSPPRGETAPEAIVDMARRFGVAWRSLITFCISCTQESRSIFERARHSIFLPVGSLNAEDDMSSCDGPMNKSARRRRMSYLMMMV